MLKRTPLCSSHHRLGARLVEFGGWEMPVHYTSILEEHLAVRQAAGIFDICHMGEVRVEGPDALEFLNGVLTNDLRRLAVGQGQYTLMCNAEGGTVDDLYAYRLEATTYLLIINASRIEPDVHWLTGRWAAYPHADKVRLENLSEQLGALAIQGPKVASFIDRAFPESAVGGVAVPAPTALNKNQVAGFRFGGTTVWVARTGYTGEDGFEIVAPANLVEGLWAVLLEDGGKSFGLLPCGLGARDTLRTEMGYPLYGHELDDRTSPLEAGLGAFVALDKGDFVGRERLVAQKSQGLTRRCVAFRMTDRSAPPRPQYPIWSADATDQPAGLVVSGTQSPSLGIGIGMGYVPPSLAPTGTRLEIEIRGRRYPAEVVPKPIYRRTSA